jgi:hypothetical protein
MKSEKSKHVPNSSKTSDNHLSPAPRTQHRIPGKARHEPQRTEAEMRRAVGEKEAQLEAAYATVQKLEQDLKSSAAAHKTEQAVSSRQLAERIAASGAAKDTSAPFQNTVEIFKREEAEASGAAKNEHSDEQICFVKTDSPGAKVQTERSEPQIGNGLVKIKNPLERSSRAIGSRNIKRSLKAAQRNAELDNKERKRKDEPREKRLRNRLFFNGRSAFGLFSLCRHSPCHREMIDPEVGDGRSCPQS